MSGKIVIDNADKTMTVGRHSIVIDNTTPEDVDGPYVRDANGALVPFGKKEREVDEAIRQAAKVQAECDRLEQQAAVSKAELDASRNFTNAAQEEAKTLREQMAKVKEEGLAPSYVEILSIDNIERDEDGLATIVCTADFGGNVMDTEIIIPINHLKTIIKGKQNGRGRR